MKIYEHDIYVGKVIYIDDITRTGRCKIRVYGLFDELDDDNIPWFTPVNSSIFSKNGGGSLDVPKIGTIVRVTFENGDVYAGQYMALENVDPALVNEIKDDYEGTHVLLYDSEEELAVLYQPMTGFKIYHKGSSIILDPNGNIQLKHQNNSNVIEVNENEIIISSGSSQAGGINDTGTINISSGSVINLHAPTINLDAENITLGHNPVKNVVTAQDLIPLLNMMKNNIIAKMPYGSPDLAPETFNSIGSNAVKISG